LERNPREMNSRLAMGTALVALQRPADALKAFEDGLRCCVQKATKCHLQALVNWCRGSLEEAVPEIEKACRLDPSNPAHPYRLGRIHLENEHPLEALEAFDVVLGLCADDTASLDHSCEALFQMGRLEEAFRRSRHSLRQDPHSIPALKRCVEYRCRARRVRRQEGTRIRQDIRKMLSWSSETAAVHQTLAGYHAGRGEWERALKVMRTLTARQPKNWLTWFYLAVWLRRAGQRAEAAAAILESHSLYRNDPRVHCAACPILAAAGRGVDKDRLVSEMISRFPSRWTVWTTAARELARQAHKEDKALSASQRALSLQPKLAQTWFTHGDILLRLGRSGEAAQHLGEAWRLMPKRQGNRQEPALAIRLAECFQSLSKGVETTGWLRRARRSAARLRRLDPPAAWLWEGRALELSGDAQGALRAYRKARSNQLFHPLRGWAEKAMQRLGGG
ncbi:MAG TPA: tetratricopeptide repeat protein, partial [Acidobacteriota bacterium]|nr:tetratricopeptide repeat protein [Acidobacteriota bacterium]